MDKETSKRNYWFRRENRLCTKCGCEMPDGDSRSLCAFCRGKNKQRKEQRKISGACALCGKEDAYTIGGRSLCAECAERNNKWHKKRRREGAPWAEKELAQKQEKYSARKREHLCVMCGKPLSDNYTFFRCRICRQYMRRANQRNAPAAISRSEAHNYNLCVWCIKRPAVHGRLCEICYPKSLKNIAKAQEAAHCNNAEHPWQAAETARVQEVRRRLGFENKRADKV